MQTAIMRGNIKTNLGLSSYLTECNLTQWNWHKKQRHYWWIISKM